MYKRDGKVAMHAYGWIKQFLCVVVLSLVGSISFAGWVSLGANSTGQTVYIDNSTIRSSANRVKLWSMGNLTTPKRTAENQEFRSFKAYLEFDCQEERIRTLATRLYEKESGEGTTVGASDNIQSWRAITPGAADSLIARVACNR